MSAEAMFAAITLIVMARAAAELWWTTETLSTACCEGQDKLLTWSFSKGENDIIRQLHWYYNTTTLICYHSESTGFHVTHLYEGRVERNGTTNILLKNLSSIDTGEYTLYPKLAEEEKENAQTISVTVYETPTHECKPAIKHHSRNVLSCSANPCGRPRFLPEWRILGIRDSVGNESYLKVNSSWNAELVLCCPQGPSINCHNGDKNDLCTAASISSTDKDVSFNEDLPDLKAPAHKDAENKDHVILVTMIIIPVLCVMIIFLVIAFIWNIWRKQKLSACKACISQHVTMMHRNAKMDEERPMELQTLQSVSESTDQELHERNWNQRLQIVNNVNLDSDFFKGMFDSHSRLTADLHSLRKENTKLQSQLYCLEHSLQFQKRQKVSDALCEMTVMVHRDTNDNDTDTSAATTDYEDNISDAALLIKFNDDTMKISSTSPGSKMTITVQYEEGINYVSDVGIHEFW